MPSFYVRFGWFALAGSIGGVQLLVAEFYPPQ